MAHYGEQAEEDKDDRQGGDGEKRGGLTQFSIRRFRYPKGFHPILTSIFVNRLTGTGHEYCLT